MTPFSLSPTVIQSSAEVEHESLPQSSESWTDAQQEPCTPTVTQRFAEHTSLPVDKENWEEKDFADPIDPIEDLSEEDHMAPAGSMAGDHPNILVRDQRKTVWMLLPSWIVLLIVVAHAWTQRSTQ